MTRTFMVCIFMYTMERTGGAHEYSYTQSCEEHVAHNSLWDMGSALPTYMVLPLLCLQLCSMYCGSVGHQKRQPAGKKMYLDDPNNLCKEVSDWGTVPDLSCDGNQNGPVN